MPTRELVLATHKEGGSKKKAVVTPQDRDKKKKAAGPRGGDRNIPKNNLDRDHFIAEIIGSQKVGQLANTRDPGLILSAFSRWHSMEQHSKENPGELDKRISAGEFVLSCTNFEKIEEIAIDKEEISKAYRANKRTIKPVTKWGVLQKPKAIYDHLAKKFRHKYSDKVFANSRQVLRRVPKYETLRKHFYGLVCMCTKLAYHMNIWKLRDMQILVREHGHYFAALERRINDLIKDKEIYPVPTSLIPIAESNCDQIEGKHSSDSGNSGESGKSGSGNGGSASVKTGKGKGSRSSGETKTSSKNKKMPVSKGKHQTKLPKVLVKEKNSEEDSRAKTKEKEKEKDKEKHLERAREKELERARKEFKYLQVFLLKLDIEKGIVAPRVSWLSWLTPFDSYHSSLGPCECFELKAFRALSTLIISSLAPDSTVKKLVHRIFHTEKFDPKGIAEMHEMHLEELLYPKRYSTAPDEYPPWIVQLDELAEQTLARCDDMAAPKATKEPHPGTCVYNTKAKALKEMATKIVETHNGRVPPRYEDLVKLPSVNQKVATILLQEVYCSSVGVGVDIHVKKISHANGWLMNKCQGKVNYINFSSKDVDHDLKQWADEGSLKDFNKVVASFGQLMGTAQTRSTMEDFIKKMPPGSEKDTIGRIFKQTALFYEKS
jgi:endonuclease III